MSMNFRSVRLKKITLYGMGENKVFSFLSVPAFGILMIVQFSFYKYFTLGSYGYKCAADYIELLNQGTFSALLIVPLMTVIILWEIEKKNNYSYILRFSDRKAFGKYKIGKATIGALFYSFCIFLLGSWIGWIYTGSWMNWNERNSSFYYENGFLTDIMFDEVFMVRFFQMFMKVQVTVCILLLIDLFVERVYGFLFLLLVSAARIFSLAESLISNITEQGTIQNYIPVSFKILYFLVLPGIMICTIFSILCLIQRKDFLK